MGFGLEEDRDLSRSQWMDGVARAGGVGCGEVPHRRVPNFQRQQRAATGGPPGFGAAAARNSADKHGEQDHRVAP
jgi:hypothetical protein